MNGAGRLKRNGPDECVRGKRTKKRSGWSSVLARLSDGGDLKRSSFFSGDSPRWTIIAAGHSKREMSPLAGRIWTSAPVVYTVRTKNERGGGPGR